MCEPYIIILIFGCGVAFGMYITIEGNNKK